jgi:hypothetical protein
VDESSSLLLVAIAAVAGVVLLAAVVSLVVLKRRSSPKTVDAPALEMSHTGDNFESIDAADTAKPMVAEQVGNEILV